MRTDLVNNGLQDNFHKKKFCALWILQKDTGSWYINLTDMLYGILGEGELTLKQGRIITRDDEIKDILTNSKTIAVLGLSPKPQRDSHMVARYLKEQEYRIIPVRPAQKEILGEKAYPSLDHIKESVDIVNVFRNSAQIMPHAHEALGLIPKPKVFWMQLNIENHEAAKLLTARGIGATI